MWQTKCIQETCLKGTDIVRVEKDHIEINGKTILVTGAAGFIGYHLCRRLLTEYKGLKVIGMDCFSDYYDVGLKEYRTSSLNEYEGSSDNEFTMIRNTIADKNALEEVFKENNPSIVVNLAAQAGVRFSIDHPDVYIESNIVGFYNILEACRHYPVDHLVYASSSSVYGGNKKVPFSTDDSVDAPISLYAATKKSNELLAHSYSKLYDIPATGLRFFTVYGPAGRPDMAYFLFTDKLVRGETIKIFNFGNCKRDFTYVDDIVEGVIRVIGGAPKRKLGDDGLPIPPYALYNIGGGQPENLMDFVHTLSEELVTAGVLDKGFNVEEHMKLVPMQPGDVPVTYADSTGLEKDYGFKPEISLRTGLREFAHWYKEYYIR